MITRGNWTDAVQQFNKHTGTEVSPLGLCLIYGICPAGLISSFAAEAWRLYNNCDGTRRIQRPHEFYSLPALYTEAVRVIDVEIAKHRRKD